MHALSNMKDPSGIDPAINSILRRNERKTGHVKRVPKKRGGSFRGTGKKPPFPDHGSRRSFQEDYLPFLLPSTTRAVNAKAASETGRANPGAFFVPRSMLISLSDPAVISTVWVLSG